MANETLRARGTRRAKKAAQIEKLAGSLYSAAFKLPEFSGKARLIDRIGRLKTRTHNLAFDLIHDAKDLPG
jgi:hypothetical protein